MVLEEMCCLNLLIWMIWQSDQTILLWWKEAVIIAIHKKGDNREEVLWHQPARHCWEGLHEDHSIKAPKKSKANQPGGTRGFSAWSWVLWLNLRSLAVDGGINPVWTADDHCLYWLQDCLWLCWLECPVEITGNWACPTKDYHTPKISVWQFNEPGPDPKRALKNLPSRLESGKAMWPPCSCLTSSLMPSCTKPLWTTKGSSSRLFSS